MKTGGRDQHHAADTGGRRRPVGFRHTLDRTCGLLSAAREFFKTADRRQLRIEQIEIGKCFRQQVRIGETGKRIFRRDARHRHRALSEHIDIGRDVVGGHHRLTRADENAQAKIVTFRALALLDAAVAHIDRQRHAAHRDRIGAVGTGPLRCRNEPLREIAQRRLIEQIALGGRGLVGDLCGHAGTLQAGLVDGT